MYKAKKGIGGVVGFLFKLIVSAIFIFPFLWMVSLSLQTDMEISRFTLIPKTPSLENYFRAWKLAPFGLYFRNSIVIIVSIIVIQTLVMVPAAYAFAKFDFKGKGILFGIILIAFMMPTQVTFIPIYYMMADFGWTDTLLPQIIPAMTNAFGIFLLRQYFMQVPDELRESGYVDGASELRIWAQIMVPIAAPGMASLAMVVFLWNWNNYLDPLVFLTNWRLYTIPIALTNFIEESVTEYNLVMAASASALLPVFIVFLAGQKFFVKGLMAGAVKG